MQEDLLQKYINSLSDGKSQYVSRARMFLKWLGSKEPNQANVRKYLEHLKSEGYAPGTVNLTFKVIKRIFLVNNITWPFRRSDTPIVSEQDVYAPMLDPFDIERMIQAARKDGSPKHRAFLAVSTIYGVRREELIEIYPSSLNLKDKLIFIRTVKRGRQRNHLIPDVILPHLAEYGFDKRVSDYGASMVFSDLKRMINFEADEVGWHSIRRSCIRAAYEAGLSEPVIHSYYRWKRSSLSMPMLYATSRVVGTRGEYSELGFDDRKIDEQVQAVHPFLKFWE